MTRFDVVVIRRMRETRNITVSGAAAPIESDLIDEFVEEVRCGWCGEADSVNEIGVVAMGADGVHGG